MRVDPRLAGLTLPAAPAGPAARPAGGTVFRLPTDKAGDARGTREGGAARSAAPLETLGALLALQAEDDPGERRRKSARRGQDILDALDGLKAALLGGKVSPADLRRITDRLAAASGPSGDPRLDAIVGEIELRAKVELAKLGQRDRV